MTDIKKCSRCGSTKLTELKYYFVCQECEQEHEKYPCKASVEELKKAQQDIVYFHKLIEKYKVPQDAVFLWMIDAGLYLSMVMG